MPGVFFALCTSACFVGSGDTSMPGCVNPSEACFQFGHKSSLLNCPVLGFTGCFFGHCPCRSLLSRMQPALAISMPTDSLRSPVSLCCRMPALSLEPHSKIGRLVVCNPRPCMRMSVYCVLCSLHPFGFRIGAAKWVLWHP